MPIRRIQTGMGGPSLNSVLGRVRSQKVSRARYGTPVGVTNVKATLTTALTGSNNDLTFTAKQAGAAGNGIRVRYVDPSVSAGELSVTVSGDDITVNLGTDPGAAATLATALTGSNNDVDFTAVDPGPDGNDITITYADPGGTTASLSVEVDGTDITVNLGRSSSAINTTANLLIAAIEDSDDASALVTVALHAGNDGTGLVTALSSTPLAGGGVGGGAIASAADEVRDVVNQTPESYAWVSAARASANNGTGVVTAMSYQSLAGGSDG